jgi:ABC-2 type transport system permease protein
VDGTPEDEGLMRAVLIIAWNDLGRVLREREALFWIFLGPLIFTVFFGLVFRDRPASPPALAVVNFDATVEVARGLSTLLEKDGIAVSAWTRVNPAGLTLEVPAGAASALKAHAKLELTLRAPADESASERSIRFKVQKALTKMYFASGVAPPSAPGDSRQEANDVSAQPDTGPLTMTQGDLGVARRDQTTGFQRSVPAYLVMFVFLNLLVSGAGIAEDRASGRLRRIAIAPVTKMQIVLGKLLGRFATGWVQIAYMLALGVVFRIRWADHPFVFFAFLSLFALMTASLGILLGTLFKDPDKCASVAVWTAIVLAPLGGLWWPLEIVGPFMRNLAYVVPTGWAMDGVNSMLAFGAGALDVAPYAAAFLAVFAVSFPLAARRLQP